MRPDDELCLCFHVTWRKVMNYIRVHRVKLPSQLANCQNAGTGCGWCRRSMQCLVQQMQDDPPAPDQVDQWLAEKYPASANYRTGRARYIAQGHGTPPKPESET
ncbi:MAG: (2Fe-2S)-binding protein [Pirellulaceae bacterium]|nr:(2Fe-2S)-binding protein [Pirellulaceae bacterium]